MPTGKVLFWGYPNLVNSHRANSGEAAVWDPLLGIGPESFHEVYPPVLDPDGPSGPQPPAPAPIYCSGQTLLPNGEVLVAGGNLIWPWEYPDEGFDHDAGLRTVFTFNPWSETWTRQPDMQAGHWYPGQELLADGRTIVHGGFTEERPGEVFGDELEIFEVGPGRSSQGTLSNKPDGARMTMTYPHLFGLPDGNVLLGGPGDHDSAILRVNGSDLGWTDLPPSSGYRWGGSAVMGSSRAGRWRLTQIGGYGIPPAGPNGELPATETTEILDARPGRRVWKPGPSLNFPRSYQNAVLLPDRTMVTIGGGTGLNAEEGNWAIGDGAQRQVELFDPKSRTWRLGPAQLEDRSYHSTALLLPDGRVWSAGDDLHPLQLDGAGAVDDAAEIYSPPYLFKGERPVVDRAPSVLRRNDKFWIHAAGPKVKSAVLMAPGATTHADDMHQRVVPLRITSRGPRGGLTLSGFTKPEIAPPGYYMLFALSARGVPSIADWVRLR